MSDRLTAVAIADDHEMIRIGLERVLSVTEGMQVVAQFSDAHQVLTADLQSVDVLLLDMNMPGSDGVSLLESVLARYPDIKAVVFSMLPEATFAPRALAAGASAFVNKGQPPGEVVNAIKAVILNGQYISEAQEDMLLELEATSGAALHHSLSQREFEILLLLAAGKRPMQIATQLEVRVGTVTTHIHRVKRKLGASSLGDLVAYAHSHKLLGS